MNTTLIILVLVIGVIAFFYIMVRRIKRLPEVAQSQKVITLNPSNFTQQTKEGIVLVDFWASWCMPCKMLAPVLNEVAETLDGQARIGKLDTEKHQQLANKFKVRSIPTMIIFRNGKEIDRIVGVKTKEFLIQKIERAKIL